MRRRASTPCSPRIWATNVEELGGGHVGIGRGPLRQIADPALGGERFGLDVMAANHGRSGGRREKTGDHLHRRRFAGAVRPEKTQHLAFRNREGHAVDRRQRAEFFDQMVDLQHTLAPQEASRSAFFLQPRHRDRTAQAAAAQLRRRYRATGMIASNRLCRKWGGAR